MAITINGVPQKYTPVYNPIGFSVTSTNKNQTNFKYVMDLYPTGATSPTYVRKKQPAEPSNGYAFMEAQAILRKFTTPMRPSMDVAINHESTLYNIYTAKFGEEYGVSSAVVVYPDLTTTSGVTFYGALDYEDFTAWNYSTYNIQGTSSKFLTHMPNTISLSENDWWRLYFINDLGYFYNVVIKTYDVNSNLIQTVQWGANYTSNEKVLSVGVGPENLALLTGAETRFSASSGLPVIGASTAFYTIELQDSSNARITQRMIVTIKTECSRNDIYRLQFLNRLGGYDPFTFTGAPTIIFNSEKSFYQKRQGSWNGTSFTYAMTDRGTTQYASTTKKTIKLISDWINNEESEWLRELIDSSDIYMYSVNNASQIPVNILDVSYQQKNTAKDKLFNIELTVELSYIDVRQGA